ncbi:MAG: hypothetical protein ACOYZ7_09600 [Chloroflexota bacterium]
MNTATPKTSPSISAREWRFVWAVLLGVLLLTSLPYLYGYLSSPPDKQFMGLMLDVPDHGQYLSWWRSFQSGLLAPNKLTPEPNEPLFFNLLWWALAQVTRFTGLGYAPLFQLFRWIAGASFLWAAYRLMAQFLTEARQRRTAFLLVTFSSGLGWVLVVLKYTLTSGELLFPLDVFIAEGNSFLCILGYPHFSFAAAFIALTFEFIWRGWREKRTRYMVIAGVLALILGWTHTYDLLIVYGVMGTFALLVWLQERAFPWPLFWGGVIIVALSCSGAIYSVILTSVDPLWEEVLAQFANAGVYTPSPPHLVIFFGLPLILAVAAWAALIWKKTWGDENLFILGWFAAGAVLNYIPTDFQIHMLNGWQLPMMILVTKGLYDLVAPALARWRSGALQKAAQWVAVVLLVAVLPTNLYLWTWRFIDLRRHDYPYYLHRDEIAALDWLRENASPDEVVLSSLTVGQYVPALSGNTAFLAHWAQTVDFYDKEQRVAAFFDTATADARRAETVAAFGVDYILYGPAERALGDYDPTATPWLTLAYTLPQVNVFSIQPDKLPVLTGSGGTP